jgi:hypothetical protein
VYATTIKNKIMCFQCWEKSIVIPIKRTCSSLQTRSLKSGFSLFSKFLCYLCFCHFGLHIICWIFQVTLHVLFPMNKISPFSLSDELLCVIWSLIDILLSLRISQEMSEYLINAPIIVFHLWHYYNSCDLMVIYFNFCSQLDYECFKYTFLSH